MRFIAKRSVKICVIFLMYSMIFLCLPSISYAQPSGSTRVVRVGFFEFDGYHEIDEQNRRSGYGYEYLHEMAKYTDWVFEYVDGTWEECQEMLKNGEIDFLTSAQYSQSRDEIFDFSATSMGTSYAQLTVLAHNTSFGRNDFTHFNGIHIGLLAGNSRNERLAEFAVEKGFSYRSTIYETQENLEYALKSGAVDAVLTSSLRKLDNEAVIAQFAPSPFYGIVKAGDDELLQEVNFALEAIEMNNPAFRYNLYQEYYGADTADTFVLSREEKEYLNENPTIRAVVRPGAAPISDWKNNEFQGITADFMNGLLSDLNLQIEYIYPPSLEEGYELLASGDADIMCLFESDYNLAERYNARITTPYLNTSCSMISRKQGKPNMKARQTIAVAEGTLFGPNYVREHYSDAKMLPVPSYHDAIETVANGEADLALVNIYTAEQEIANYPNLRATFISDAEQQFSIGVSQGADARLYSILDKKISTMSSQMFNDILVENTMFHQAPINLGTYFRQHPVEFIMICAAFFAVIVGVLLYIIIIKSRYAKNIYSLAYVDTLTELWNSNGFLLHGQALLTKNPKTSFAVVAIDLSHFYGINESYGRNFGDKVIVEMGHILRYFGNEQTILAHFEADRFFMLRSYSNKDEMHATLTEIISMLSSCKIDDLMLQLHAHIGVGFVESKENGLLQALDHASITRTKCTLDTPIVYMDGALKTSLLREKEIRNHAETALAQEEFEVYYQPKVNMLTREIIGAEALVRWNHSKLGFLSPAEFLPVFEKNNFIIELDFFVFEEACKLIQKRSDAGYEPIVISVNQSRAHFLKSNYIERLQNVLIKYNIQPKQIELEITETLFGQEAITNSIIKKLKSIGLLISIDDFGSGYSSLHMLHQISVDILKIDKGLLDESDKEEKMRNIIYRVVQIAADLNVDVICEGVESEDQMRFLLGVGCKYAQGYLFSKPLPLPEFERLLESQRNSQCSTEHI